MIYLVGEVRIVYNLRVLHYTYTGTFTVSVIRKCQRQTFVLFALDNLLIEIRLCHYIFQQNWEIVILPRTLITLYMYLNNAHVALLHNKQSQYCKTNIALCNGDRGQIQHTITLL